MKSYVILAITSLIYSPTAFGAGAAAGGIGGMSFVLSRTLQSLAPLPKGNSASTSTAYFIQKRKVDEHQAKTNACYVKDVKDYSDYGVTLP